MDGYAVQIVERFGFHGSVSFGLSVDGPPQAFPLVLGCSLRTRDGQVVDVAARYIDSAGVALWDVKADQRFKVGDRGTLGAFDGWSGSIIFALWRDHSFRERIVDTGWHDWSAPWLIGASIAGVEENERLIQDRYAARSGALRSSPALEKLVTAYVPPPAEIDWVDKARSLAVKEAEHQGVDLEFRGAWVKKRTAEIAESLKKNKSI